MVKYCPSERLSSRGRERLAVLLLGLCLATASSFGPGWQVGSLQQSATQDDASSCGYPNGILDTGQWPYGQTAAVSIYNSQAACGNCIEITAGDSQDMASFTVQVVAICQNCGTSVVLSNTTQGLPERSTSSASSSVHFRRVACQPPGNVKLQANIGSSGELYVVPLQVGGAGSITAIDVRSTGSGDSGWNGMTYVLGALFSIQTPPHAPLDFRMTLGIGPQLLALKVVPSAGSNATFPTGVQAAAEGLPAGPALIKPPLTIAPTLALSPAPSKISAQPAPKGSSKPLATRSQPPFPQPPRSQPPQASAGQPLPTLAQPGAGQPLASQPGRAPGPVPTVPAPSLAPSVEDVLLQNAQAVQTEEVAQTLLQMESISIERAMAMQLPLCVPVEIGQLNRCVAVTYGASPRPSAYHAPPVGRHHSLDRSGFGQDAHTELDRLAVPPPTAGGGGMPPSSPAAGPALPPVSHSPAGSVLGPALQQQRALGPVPQPALSSAVAALSPLSTRLPAPEVLTSPPLILSQLPITFAAAPAHQAVPLAPIPARVRGPSEVLRTPTPAPLAPSAVIPYPASNSPEPGLQLPVVQQPASAPLPSEPPPPHASGSRGLLPQTNASDAPAPAALRPPEAPPVPAGSLISSLPIVAAPARASAADAKALTKPPPALLTGGLPAPAAQQLATEVASGTLTTLPSNESATGAPPVAASTLAPPQLRKPILPPGAQAHSPAAAEPAFQTRVSPPPQIAAAVSPAPEPSQIPGIDNRAPGPAAMSPGPMVTAGTSTTLMQRGNAVVSSAGEHGAQLVPRPQETVTAQSVTGGPPRPGGSLLQSLQGLITDGAGPG